MRQALLLIGVVTVLFAQNQRFPPLNPIPPAGAQSPAAIRKVDPAYTPEALAAGIEGTVTLYAEIGADGRPHRIRVIHSLGYGLDKAAVEAVRHWEFAPATRDGKRVAALVTIEVPFRLAADLPVRV